MQKRVELLIQDRDSFVSDLGKQFLIASNKSGRGSGKGISTSYVLEQLTGKQFSTTLANYHKNKIKDLFAKHEIPFQMTRVGWIPVDSQTKFEFVSDGKANVGMKELLTDVESENQQEEIQLQQSTLFFGKSPQQILSFLEARLAEKLANGERAGISTVEFCTWLGLECTPSNQVAYSNLAQDFFCQSQINWQIKAGCGFVPVEKEHQDDGLLFGKTHSEVVTFLENRAQEKETLEPHKIPGVNSSEICEWLEIQKNPANKRNIKDYILTFIEGWEICQSKGFVKVGRNSEETQEIIEEIEQELGISSSTSLKKPSLHDKLQGILQIAIKTSEVSLAAVKEIAAL